MCDCGRISGSEIDSGKDGRLRECWRAVKFPCWMVPIDANGLDWRDGARPGRDRSSKIFAGFLR